MIYEVVEVVIDKLIRTFKLKEWQYDIEECVEDLADALKLICAAKVFEDKVELLTFNSMVAPLPKDLQHIKEVLDSKGGSAPYTESGSFIQGNYADGTQLALSYQAMPVDARGYILVPDNAAVREALMWYMVKVLILQREITHITLAFADQEWHWRCGSARAELNVWNVQQASNTYNDFVRLNPLKDQHTKGYQEVGKLNTLDRVRNDTQYGRR